MKKVLFATTALIATASVAAADVRLSGYGRFGLAYDDGRKDVNTNYGNANNYGSTLTSRLRLQFDMSAETDNGIAFGARFRAQAESRGNAPGGAAFNGGRFWLTSNGFTLQVGNILGAVENMPGTYLETISAGTGVDGQGFASHVGNVNGTYFNWDAYSSAGPGVNGIEVLYTSGGFGGQISYSQRNRPAGTPAGPVVAGTTDGLKRAAINLFYNWNDWTIAAAYQDSNRIGEDKALIAIYGDLGQFGVRFAYADNDGIAKYGLYGNVDIGAASNLVAWVTSEDDYTAVVNGPADANTGGTNYGLNYQYDLGGGVTFVAGASRTIVANAVAGGPGVKVNRAQAGVYFSF